MTKNRKKLIYYILSLPERFVRSTVSGVTGITSILTDLALPKVIKESATYRVTFGMLQQFLIEKVAEIEPVQRDIELVDHYLVRKTAGSMIEGIGLLSIQFSPVWMLAILSDFTGGSGVYLKRLTNDLKKEGLIGKDVNYNTAIALLEAIRIVGDKGVRAIDTPPISKEELLQFKNEMKEAFQKNNEASYQLYKEMEKVYLRMEKASKEEDISIKKLSGLMALDAMKGAAGRKVNIFRTGTMTSGKLLYELFIDSYKESLDHLNHVGKRAYLINYLTPFTKQIKNHYSKEKESVTQKILGFFFGKDKSEVGHE